MLTASHPRNVLPDLLRILWGGPTAQGQIRLDVAQPPSPQPRIATPGVAVVYSKDPTVIDPLANDVDPNGALLSVQSASVSGSAPIAVPSSDAAGSCSATSDRLAAVAPERGTRPSPVHRQRRPCSERSRGGLGHREAKRQLNSRSRSRTTPTSGQEAAASVLANDTDSQGEPLVLVPGELNAVSGSGTQFGAACVADGVVRYVAPPTARYTSRRTSPSPTWSWTVLDTRALDI